MDVEKQHIFDIDFKRVQASFWKSFSKVFLRKFRENCINRILAKTLKISISSWENAYFKGFEDNTNAKTIIKYFEKIDVFWNFDFEGILGRFWKGFGRPKSSIFAFFSMFFRSHF